MAKPVGRELPSTQLRGAARQGYAPVGPLGLIGLAARRRAGTRAASPATSTRPSVTVGLARVGQHDRLFDPVSAFHDESLWRVGPLRELIGARVDLQGARLSPEGRLSQAQETVGWKTAWVPDTAELRAWPIAFDDWQALEERMRDLFSSRLTGRGDGPALVALLPAEHLPARFDAVGHMPDWGRRHPGRRGHAAARGPASRAPT